MVVYGVIINNNYSWKPINFIVANTNKSNPPTANEVYNVYHPPVSTKETITIDTKWSPTTINNETNPTISINNSALRSLTDDATFGQTIFNIREYRI